ncbi:dienelactone hydrolase family protein [Erythrobacter litoralis]|uniref:dienelactone hydrolase family protein n=1 Tax=Erythrobacter litoralis TaxID=39960 RepID=UPI002435FD72|nr:dienelactone hydrolase family protein [Erythrobacter litoralis]MDG6079279.1 dienelactone hydrolase family protein [Erythrobacter litoralis]
MCNKRQLAEWGRQSLTRRSFGAATITAGATAACAPMDANMGSGSTNLAETSVSFATSAGTMDGFFVHPSDGKHAPVLFWPDIAGLREAKRQMARRLARQGYAVFVANPYYRDVTGEQFADFATFAAQDGFQKVKPWREKLDAAAIGVDASAVAQWFAGQDAVDPDRRMGTQGYCMGGPFTIWSAAAVPRLEAAASFHGGGLVRDGENSPHRMLREPVHYLIAIAQDDDAESPNAKTELRQAADRVGCEAEIDVYPADHGWCVPDSPAYNEAQAERAWSRLLAIYSDAL